MRVVLVGPPRTRERLRTALASGAVEIVGEALTIEAARTRGLVADAFVLSTDDHTDEQPSLLEPLTARELEVLRLVAEGLPNKAIATRLAISDQTVKFHVASINGKLGATNRTEAARLAIRRGLIDI